jgi:hypothetical protein
MDTSVESQASEATDVSISKSSYASVDSGYETGTINTSAETPDNLPPKASTSEAEKEGDLSTKGDADSDASKEDDYVKSLVKRLEQVESELKELKTGEWVSCFSICHSTLTYLPAPIKSPIPMKSQIIVQNARRR